MISLIFLFILLLTIGYWYFTKAFKYWKHIGVNGPIPLPLLGNSVDILLTPKTDLELKYYKTYGNIYGYFLGDKSVLVVGEPELIKAMMVKDFSAFPHRRINEITHPIIRKSLNHIGGVDWRRVRSITSPTFTSNKMKVMYPLMENCMKDFMVHLDELAKIKSNVNIKEIFGNLTLDVIASSVFGTKLNLRNELDSLFVKHARALFRIDPIKILLMKILPRFVYEIFVKPVNSSRESLNFYIDFARQIIENRKRSGQKCNDFIQLLIDADESVTNENKIDDSQSHHVNEGKEELEVEKNVLNLKLNSKNKKLHEDEIIAQAVVFMLAGYETTATSLTYATYELALNPHIQDKLYDEVTSALNSFGKIDYEVLSRLPYLDAVISEVLRHYSPLLKTARTASQEYKVGDTGITVYSGQQVDIPIYAIHHDEKYYPKPFEFDPERFMPENKNLLVPYTYLPFGGGPRHCIGMRFSLLESKLALAQMVQRFKFFRCNETDVPLIPDPKAVFNVPKRAIVGIEMRK